MFTILMSRKLVVALLVGATTMSLYVFPPDADGQCNVKIECASIPDGACPDCGPPEGLKCGFYATNGREDQYINGVSYVYDENVLDSGQYVQSSLHQLICTDVYGCEDTEDSCPTDPEDILCGDEDYFAYGMSPVVLIYSVECEW